MSCYSDSRALFHYGEGLLVGVVVVAGVVVDVVGLPLSEGRDVY